MKKTYVTKVNFWIGEINKEIKVGTNLFYDDEVGLLTYDSKTYDVKNLKSAIKAEWLVPIDGKYPELDGPVGETIEQAGDRKRKERFAEMAKNKENKIIKDEREVKRIKGCIEESDPAFYDALGVDIKTMKASEPKFNPKKIETLKDDTRFVKKISENKEVSEIKKAMNPSKEKKEIKAFEIFDDHFDSDAIQVGKYVEENKDNTVNMWPTLHWTKKADMIKDISNKEVLSKLKNIEKSDKILKRINNKLETM